MAKPTINTNPVSAGYSLGRNERRVEFSGEYGGGLINFVSDADREQTRVELYRLDPGVSVSVSGHKIVKDDGVPSDVERALAAVLDYVFEVGTSDQTTVDVGDLVRAINNRVPAETCDAVARWRQRR